MVGLGFLFEHDINFLEGYPDRQALDEGQRTKRSKRCDNNNKNVDNSSSVNMITPHPRKSEDFIIVV